MFIRPGFHVDGLVQDRSSSNALAMELPQSCTKPSISCHTEFIQIPICLIKSQKIQSASVIEIFLSLEKGIINHSTFIAKQSEPKQHQTMFHCFFRNAGITVVLVYMGRNEMYSVIDITIFLWVLSFSLKYLCLTCFGKWIQTDDNTCWWII